MRVQAALLAGWLTWMSSFGALAQADPSPQELYQQLDQTVAAKDWAKALQIVQQLQQQDPQRAQELQTYALQLQQLVSPSPQPLTDEIKDEIKVESVSAKVTQTREDEIVVGKVDIANCPGGRTRSVPLVYTATLPDEYEVSVNFTGAIRPATVAYKVKFTVQGSQKKNTVNKIVQMGSVARNRISFSFSTGKVPDPTSVIIKIEKGTDQSFPLSLPSKNTVLEHDSPRPQQQDSKKACT